MRLGVTTATGVSQWDDARGSVGFGPSLTQATGASQPAFTTGDDVTKLITFNGTSSFLSTASFAGFNCTTALTVVVVGAAATGANQYYMNVLNGTADGFAGRVVTAGYNTQANDASGFPAAASGVQAGATRRVIFHGITTTSIVEVPSQVQAVSAVHAALGNVSRVLGIGTNVPFSSSGTALTLRAVVVLPGAYTAAQRNSIDSWAVANHAAVLA